MNPGDLFAKADFVAIVQRQVPEIRKHLEALNAATSREDSSLPARFEAVLDC